MSDLPRELTYRLTYADWVDWGRARVDAVFLTKQRGTVATALGWFWYFAIVTGWAAGVAFGAEVAFGSTVQVPAFILAVVLISGVLAAQETAGTRSRSINERAQFEASIYCEAEIRLTLDETAATIEREGVLYRIAWNGVVAVRRTGTVIVIACDRGLGGIAVPLRAVPDPTAFEAALKARVVAAGGRLG